MMKATQVRLRLLLSMSIIILGIISSFGEENNLETEELDVLIIQHTKQPNSLFDPNTSLVESADNQSTQLMMDTVCTSMRSDTFFVDFNSKITSYIWNVPTGAMITNTIGDTMIIIDWLGAESGLQEICVQSVNDCGTSPSVCFPIQVSICNDPPVAENDQYTTGRNIDILVNILANDKEPNNDSLSIHLTPTNAPDNGVVNLNENDVFYKPNNNFIGLDTFDYSICDNGIPILCDTARVIIIVESQNDPPIAMDDTNSTDEDVSVNGMLLLNDFDPQNDSLFVTISPIKSPKNGTITFNQNGTYSYIGDHNFNGLDTISYEVCDNNLPILCDTANLIITVLPVNDSPIAEDNTNNTQEDTPVNGSVLPNDSDPDGDILYVEANTVSGPQNGALVLNLGGSYTYTPKPNFVGRDTFLYVACDSGNPNLCDTAQVIITVGNINDKPIAVDDNNSTEEDTPVNGMVLINDLDIDNDQLLVNTSPVSDPQNGNIQLNLNGSYIYTPDLNFNGVDSFRYEVCDNGTPILCDTAQVLVTVNPVNDPPTAINDLENTNEDVAVNGNLLTNDEEVDGDEILLEVSPLSGPINGHISIQPDGQFTYIPDTNFNGIDIIDYKICDNGIPVLCDTGQLIITVNPVNDPPIALDNSNVTEEDTPVNGSVLPNDVDPEGEGLFVNTIPIKVPTYGVLTLNLGGSYTYVPHPNFYGVDTFYYEACDGGIPSLCDTALVVITVKPVNDAPYAIEDINIIPKNGTATGGLLDNDFDLEGDDIFIKTSPISQPVNGTVTIHPNGSYTYIAEEEYVGEAEFEYQICDSGIPQKCDTGRVTIEIIENNSQTNDPPVGVNDIHITLVNTPVNSNLITNDFDPDGDLIFITTLPIILPTSGSVTIQPDGTFEYIPNQNFIGEDHFTYKVCDDQNPSLCTEVNVRITVVPITPGINFTFANDDAFSTNEETSVSGDLLANDFDPEGHNQNIHATPIRTPTNGSVSINLDGTFIYFPAQNYFGPDQFTYLICDNGTPSACDSAVVYLIVFGKNDPPIALGDINNTILNTPVMGNVLINDLEIDGDQLILNTISSSLPQNGSLKIDIAGNYTYTPAQGFLGEDAFSYEVCDNQIPALCDTATVIIEVVIATPHQNNPPNGVEDFVQTYAGLPYTGNLISNDSDIDGDLLSISTTILNNLTSTEAEQDEISNSTLNGNIELFPDGTFSYKPKTGFIGVETFHYKVCDNGNPSLCDTVLVTIDVLPNPFNSPMIFAGDDAGMTWEDQPITQNLIANDFATSGQEINVQLTLVRSPENGIVNINTNGNFIYTPFVNYNGPDRFSYWVCEDQNNKICDTATVYLTVLPFQDPPIAKADINLTLVNTSVTGLVLTNDEEPDGDKLIVQTNPILQPQNGTVSLSPIGIYQYTPNQDFIGEDQFSYVVCDDQNPALCDTAMVNISVISNQKEGNNPPVGVVDVVFGISNTPLSGDLLSNDTDPDGHPLVINTIPINQPNHGTIAINPDGTFTFIPDPNFTGKDEFQYEVCDLGSPFGCDTVMVSIEIFPEMGNTIFANDDAATGLEDTPVQGELIVNDFDPEGDEKIVNTLPVALPQHGTLTINSNGSFSYFPKENYNGPDWFEYEVCDNQIPVACDRATVYLTILPVPEMPCTQALPSPTLLSRGPVCFTGEVELYFLENYDLVTTTGEPLDYEFIWYNSLGNVISITDEPNLSFTANDPLAISPFTAKVRLEGCSSDFANPLAVEIIQLPEITASNASGPLGVCKNFGDQLFVTSIPDADYEWRIQGDQNSFSTKQNPLIPILTNTTSYEVKVSPFGCDTFATSSITINVNEGPTINPALTNEQVICEGTETQLVSNASGNTPLTYQWNGPNGFNTTATNPLIGNTTISHSGTYTLQVTDIFGCEATGELLINSIKKAPIKAEIFNNSPVCLGENIELNAQSPNIGTTITYNWINGLGNTVGTDKNLSLPANDSAAVSPFILFLTEEGCISEGSNIVSINLQGTPTAIASSNKTIVCKGGEVQLYARGVHGATYEWRMLNSPAIISIDQNPILSDIQKSMDYTLTVRSSICEEKIAQDTVRVEVSSPIEFEPLKNYQLNTDCSPADLELAANMVENNNENIRNYDFQWTGPNNYFSKNENLIIREVNESFNGLYTLAITDQNGCTTEKSMYVNDIQNAVAIPVITAENKACSNDNLTLKVPNYEGVDVVYNWFKNGEQLIESTNDELFVDDATLGATYQVIIKVEGCTLESQTIQPRVFEQPTVSIMDQEIIPCPDSLRDLTINVTIQNGQAPYEISWTGPNGFISFAEDPTLINATNSLSGTYSIEVVDKNGCSTKASTLIDIVDPLSKPIIQTSQAVCEGGLMVLTAPLYEGIIVNNSWLKNGALIANENSHEITIGPLVNNNDTYQFQAQIDGCTVSSEIFMPKIITGIQLNPTYELSELCEGGRLQLNANNSQSIGNSTYNWSGPNGFTSTAANPIITTTNAKNNGTYTLEVNSASGCSSFASLTITEILATPKSPIIITNGPVCSNGIIELIVQETDQSSQMDFVWYNKNWDTIGRERIVRMDATDPLASPPFYAKTSIQNCGEATSVPIRLEVIEIPKIIASNNGPICPNQSVILSASKVKDAEYYWTNSETGELISTEQSPVINNLTTQTSFDLNIALQGCNSGNKITTTVNIKEPLEIADMSPSTSICAGQDLTFIAKAKNTIEGGIKYTWTGPNGFQFSGLSTENEFPLRIPNFRGSQAGSYELLIEQDGNCASEKRSIIIGVIDDLKTPTLQLSSNLVCSGEAISLTASTPNGSDVSYQWYIQTDTGGIFFVEETVTPTLVINQAELSDAGDYLVRVKKGSCLSGYSNTVSLTVLDINMNIPASNNSTIDNPICEGGYIQLSVPYFEGANYTWFGPAGFTSDQPNPLINSVSLQAEGDYFAVISVEGCTNVTSTISRVYINPQPLTPTIINSGPICVGSSMKLTISNELGINGNDIVSFDWFHAATNAIIATTSVPNLLLSNIQDNQSGNYYVQYYLNGCSSIVSNETEVVVLSEINLKPNAGQDQNYCIASKIQLSATKPTTGIGKWTSPTGALINDPSLAITEATDLTVGLNQFIWTVTGNQCGEQLSDTVDYQISSLTQDIASAGLDREICETEAVLLSATNLIEATGLWKQPVDQINQGVIVKESNNPISRIDGLDPGNTYTFIWEISQNDCTNFDSDTVQLTINDLPPNNALIREETVILCDEDQLDLIAEIPTFSLGRWSNNSGAIIADPTKPETFTESLDPGKNVFVWSLSNGACLDYSSDSIIVYSERMPLANADNYNTNLNDSINLNLLENDVLQTNMDYNFIITKYPDNGEIIEQTDGTLTYKPANNFFGLDNFRYKLCSSLCEDLCDTAMVSIAIIGSEGSGECLIPNVISPNNDGTNDVFLVSCIDQFPDNQLRIFNRWGDKVYDVRNYKNNWAGTYKEAPLPAGTYFYLLQLNENATPVQGFITIFR